MGLDFRYFGLSGNELLVEFFDDFLETGNGHDGTFLCLRCNIL